MCGGVHRGAWKGVQRCTEVCRGCVEVHRGVCRGVMAYQNVTPVLVVVPSLLTIMNKASFTPGESRSERENKIKEKIINIKQNSLFRLV